MTQEIKTETIKMVTPVLPAKKLAVTSCRGCGKPIDIKHGESYIQIRNMTFHGMECVGKCRNCGD